MWRFQNPLGRKSTRENVVLPLLIYRITKRESRHEKPALNLLRILCTVVQVRIFTFRLEKKNSTKFLRERDYRALPCPSPPCLLATALHKKKGEPHAVHSTAALSFCAYLPCRLLRRMV